MYAERKAAACGGQRRQRVERRRKTMAYGGKLKWQNQRRKSIEISDIDNVLTGIGGSKRKQRGSAAAMWQIGVNETSRNNALCGIKHRAAVKTPRGSAIVASRQTALRRVTKRGVVMENRVCNRHAQRGAAS
jgi:hypothetical protein